ncbi:YdaU family protein [Magnetovibrio sp.]|uniref:YdaU family protein n=1 Tax=Magnetovibrio sp. TaxID=2024836 RepID=UPI002F93A2FB
MTKEKDPRLAAKGSNSIGGQSYQTEIQRTSGCIQIWMPTFIGDYLKETMMLSTVEHGAYSLLRIAYWQAGGALPDDDEVLRNISKTSSHVWKKIRPKIAKLFSVENGMWKHAQLDQEYARALENKKKNTQRAKNAAEARWR